ncbi:unnamed protein product, partial [Protopolystoma xenopodis]
EAGQPWAERLRRKRRQWRTRKRAIIEPHIDPLFHQLSAISKAATAAAVFTTHHNQPFHQQRVLQTGFASRPFLAHGLPIPGMTVPLAGAGASTGFIAGPNSSRRGRGAYPKGRRGRGSAASAPGFIFQASSGLSVLPSASNSLNIGNFTQLPPGFVASRPTGLLDSSGNAGLAAPAAGAGVLLRPAGVTTEQTGLCGVNIPDMGHTASAESINLGRLSVPPLHQQHHLSANPMTAGQSAPGTQLIANPYLQTPVSGSYLVGPGSPGSVAMTTIGLSPVGQKLQPGQVRPLFTFSLRNCIFVYLVMPWRGAKADHFPISI